MSGRRRRRGGGTAQVARPGNYAPLGGVSSFTRADATTCATYTDTAGVVHTVAANVLRDAHATFSASVGQLVPTILLEESRENLVLHATDFSQTWTGSTAGGGSLPVVTAAQAGAPDGTSTASKIVFAAPVSGDLSLIGQNVTTITSSAYAGSFYVKAFGAGDVGKTIVFRGVASSAFQTVTLTAQWQRVSTVEIAGGVSEPLSFGLRPAVGGSSGTVTVFAWGGDIELGSFATSALLTTTTQLTRAVDALVFVGTPYNGTLFYHYFDLSTGAWADAVASYTANSTITPPVNRAYSHLAVVLGGQSLTVAQCKAAIGGAFPT